MSLAPLLLEDYFFTKLHLEANKEYLNTVDQSVSQEDVDVGVGIVVYKDQEDPYRHQITLDINEIKSEKTVLPYEIRLQVVGIFRVDKSFPHKNIDKLVQVNGASMLYGAAREYLLMITGRSPFRGFQLPTVNFYAAISEQENGEGEKSDSKKVK